MKSLFFFLLLFCSYLGAFERNPFVAPAVWNELTPYFLPESHPIKKKLDKIFLKDRVTTSPETLKKAGFKLLTKPRKNHATIVKHSDVKGYILKLFTDVEPITCEWINWKQRILGTYYILKSIEKHQLHSLFKVPKKWIYPLPLDPQPKPGTYPKYFILVAENMHLLKDEDNYFQWRSIAITPKILKNVFTILNEVGLIDSVYPTNIPFAKDRKIAFIDTEHYHHWPVPFHKLTRFLAPSAQHHWTQITGG